MSMYEIEYSITELLDCGICVSAICVKGWHKMKVIYNVIKIVLQTARLYDDKACCVDRALLKWRCSSLAIFYLCDISNSKDVLEIWHWFVTRMSCSGCTATTDFTSRCELVFEISLRDRQMVGTSTWKYLMSNISSVGNDTKPMKT